MTKFFSLFKDADARGVFGSLIVLVCAIAAGVCLIGSIVQAVRAEESNTTYALICEVVEVDRATDTVTVQDFNGNLWAFSGCDDWVEGDSCGIVMNTMGTTSIYDDEIENVKYGGWSLMDWRE